jgi:hypothetical protein
MDAGSGDGSEGADRPEGGTDGSVLDGGVAEAPIRVLRGGASIGARVDLGDVTEGAQGAPVELELENRGDVAFDLGSIELFGGDANAFELVPPNETSIPAGARVTFRIFFRPPAIAAYSSRVEVRGAIGASRVAAFEVSGRGVEVVIGPTRKLFVAVGLAGRRVVSENGRAWTDSVFEPGPAGDDDQQFRGVGYGAGVYVAVGGAALGRIMWSRDGTNWIEVSDNASFLGGVAYGNGMFVAVGSSGRYVRSADGNRWTDPGRLPGPNFRAIAYGAGSFVAVGDNGRRSISEDGMNWTDTATGGPGLTAVVYAVDRFVAVGQMGRRVISLDGRSWTNDVVEGGLLRGVTYGEGRFVAVGGARAVTSTSGVSWTEHGVMGASLNAVAFGDGMFVAVGFRDRRFISDDGMAFTETASDDDPNLIAVTFGSGQ